MWCHCMRSYSTATEVCLRGLEVQACSLQICGRGFDFVLLFLFWIRALRTPSGFAPYRGGGAIATLVWSATTKPRGTQIRSTRGIGRRRERSEWALGHFGCNLESRCKKWVGNAKDVLPIIRDSAGPYR